MSNRTIQDVAIEQVHCHPQVRDRLVEEDQVALAQSIRANGILVPLVGHLEDGRIVVDDGHRRLDAARRASLNHVPMLISDCVPTQADLVQFQLVVNCQRADLTTMEKSRAIDRLMKDTGWTASQVSLELGCPSPANISKLRTLQLLPKRVQDLVDAGGIPMSSAYVIATVEDAKERDRLIEEVLAGRLSRDRLVEEVKNSKMGSTARRSKTLRKARRERVRIPLGGGRSISVSAPSLSVADIVAWLLDLAARFTHAGTGGRQLSEVVKEVSKSKP